MLNRTIWKNVIFAILKQKMSKIPELDEIDITSVSDEVIEKMEFTKWKWVCKYEGCSKYTHIKDYGVFPLFRFRKKWINVFHTYLLCGIHYKLRKTKLILKNNCVFIDDDKLTIS